MNRRIVLLTVLAIMVIGSLQAKKIGHDEFSVYSKYYVGDVLDITWKRLNGFAEMNRTYWIPLVDYYFFSKMTLKSKDGNVLVQYPNMDYMLTDSLDKEASKGWPRRPRTQIREEIRNEEAESIEIFVGEQALFNADTVWVVSKELKQPFQGKYSYAVNIYAKKAMRPPMIFRCVFTEAGKANKEKFLSRFYKTIKYRDVDGWKYDHGKEEKALFAMYKARKKYLYR